LDFDQSAFDNFIKVSGKSAIENLIRISGQWALGNFIWISNNRPLGILLHFEAIGNWEFCLDFKQSAIGNFIWILDNPQLGMHMEFEQSAVGNSSGFRAIGNGEVYLDFWAIGNWEFYLDFGYTVIGSWYFLGFPRNRQFNWEFDLAFKAIGSWVLKILYLDFGRLAVGNLYGIRAIGNWQLY